MSTFARRLALFLAIAVAALAADIKIGTLNCYLLFNPAIDHAGNVPFPSPYFLPCQSSSWFYL